MILLSQMQIAFVWKQIPLLSVEHPSKWALGRRGWMSPFWKDPVVALFPCLHPYTLLRPLSNLSLPLCGDGTFPRLRCLMSFSQQDGSSSCISLAALGEWSSCSVRM